MKSNILAVKSYGVFIFLFLMLVSLKAQDGNVKTYYPSGRVQSELSYINDVLEGPAVWYYENGNLKTEKYFRGGILNGPIKEYYDSGLLKEEYRIADGVKDDIDKSYYPNGGLKEISKFSLGKSVERATFDFDPAYNASPRDSSAGKRFREETAAETEVTIKSATSSELRDTTGVVAAPATVYGTTPGIAPATIQVPLSEPPPATSQVSIPLPITAPDTLSRSTCGCEVCPEIVGGIEALQKNVVYPEYAFKYGLEGRVTLKAEIGIQGEVLKTEIINGMGLGCEEAAVEAVAKTKFLPGKNKGVPVEAHLIIFVEFKLSSRK